MFFLQLVIQIVKKLSLLIIEMSYSNITGENLKHRDPWVSSC